MTQSITLTPEEIVQIVGDHLACIGKIPNKTQVNGELWTETQDNITNAGLTISWEE